jgi:malonate-semialdehyde dehydrogenase (acetylating)/methylmalonate-semialdehyde dehydrogenase
MWSKNPVRIPAVSDVHNFVSGHWVPGSLGSFEIHSPYTGALIGRLKTSSASDVAQAVAGAQAASMAWGRTPLKERSQVMFRFREILLRDLEKIAHVKSSECGKTLAEGKAGLMKGVEVLEFALSLQNLDEGAKLEVSRGVTCEFRREPLGVVAAITPFNFPGMVPMWMIPIAITLGNALVWKPSDKTPLTSILIAGALREAGLPDGVLTLVQGGKEAVDAILDHPDVAAVGFVGSTPVARHVYERGSARGKRVLALGGAKNHIILMPDADPEMAAQGIADSFTGCAGQRCMAASVLLSVGAPQDNDAILEKLSAKVAAVRLGEDMGALITRESRDRLTAAIERAAREGAEIRVDGRKQAAPAGAEGGNWLAPTLLDRVRPGTEAACDELFGPVLSIVRVANLSDALAIEASNPYGNAASVFTSSGAVAERVAHEARAGMIGVNIGVPVPREPFSFGGTGASKFGHGDITGVASLGLWSNLKKVTAKWVLNADRNWMN